MDRFTKAVFAVIAVSLVAIAAKLWAPSGEAHAQGMFSGAPTIGEFRDAKTDEQRDKLNRRIPVIRVQGGYISIN